MPPEGLPAVDGGETAVTLFRHTSASLLLAEGVPARVVMEILGHSQIGVTLNTYTHVDPQLNRDAAQRIERLLGGESEPNG